jgi:ubiquinone/menaquinone biosynthesis methyltransferase
MQTDSPIPEPSLDARRNEPHAHDAGVRAMFSRIAPRYDLVNRVLSGGLDQRWRRRVVSEVVGAPRGPRLDVCAGTLDLAAMLAAAEPKERVVAIDLTAEMMKRGRAKAPSVETIVGDACALPFEDETFGAITCGFGVRNVSAPDEFAREALRVLIPGGALVVLEAFRPERALAAFMHRAYVGRVFPVLGAIASRDRAAYDYFVRSVGSFLTRRDTEKMLATTGFCDVHGYDVTLGMAGIVIATKPGRSP